jgi:DNA-binding transcriptional ArsR family regulator
MAALSCADAAALASVAKTLSSPPRLQLLSLLRSRPQHPFELQDELKRSGTYLTQPTVSYHLGKLVDGGLTSVRREGPFTVYDLTPAGERAATMFLGAR